MKIGDVIHLIGENEKEEPFNYKSKVIDIEDKYLYIDYPVDVYTDRTVFLQLNHPFYVKYADDLAVYEFKSVALARANKVIPVLKIVLPEKDEFKKIQRRNYLRVNTAVDVAVHCPEDTFAPFTTVTRDISGGGACVIIPHQLKNINIKKDQELNLYFVLRFSQTDYAYIESTAKTVRVVKDSEPAFFSVSFLDNPLKNEQTLVRFCFQIQREELRHRL